LTAWLAAHCGDVEKQRRALERLIAVNPADLSAIDRLVAIAHEEGKADRALELRRMKTEVDRLEARYGKLYKRNQTIRDAAEMARLAEQLGQPFEAKVFLTIAIATGPKHSHLRDQLVRASQNVSKTQSPGGNLAGLLAHELDAADRTTTR
jgi:enediyne biosynthesis protein E4